MEVSPLTNPITQLARDRRGHTLDNLIALVNLSRSSDLRVLRLSDVGISDLSIISVVKDAACRAWDTTEA